MFWLGLIVGTIVWFAFLLLPREPHECQLPLIHQHDPYHFGAYSAKGLLNELKDLGFTQEEVYFMFYRRLCLHQRAMAMPEPDAIEVALSEQLDIITGRCSPERRVWDKVLGGAPPQSALFLHAYPTASIIDSEDSSE